MGVQGLQTFIETCVQNGCRPVNIVHEARKHTLRNAVGTKPTVVVDGLSLITWLYNRTCESIYGGPWRHTAHIVTEFVRSFRERGIDLVFFFDGCVSSSKARVWRTRRSQRVREIKQMFQKLRAHCWTELERSCPNGTSHTLCFVVKYLTSCKVFYAVEECDKEIARYAQTHPECFAVLSQDSDFAIYNMSVLYCSSLYLDIRTLQTYTYDGKALACHLGLSPELLPLFACLAGNDTVGKEYLKKFHGSLGSTPHRYGNHATRFQQIAAIIRQSNWNAIPDATVALRTGVNLDLLMEGVNTYNLNDDCTNFGVPLGIDEASWSLVLGMYKTAAAPPSILQVLHGREIYLGETMEEPIAELNLTIHSCFRGLRSKIYWVLFGGDETVFITEHVTYPAYIGIRDESVAPCAPFNFQGQVPRLCHLWSEDPSLDTVRWSLFCACVEMEGQLELLKTVPYYCVVLCCILRRLFLFKVIGETELSALILQCILPDDKKLELSERQIENNQVDADLVVISAYIMVGVQNVTMALSACGRPVALQYAAPWLFFDGKLFHVTHQELHSGTSVASVLEHNVPRILFFNHLWKIVTATS